MNRLAQTKKRIGSGIPLPVLLWLGVFLVAFMYHPAAALAADPPVSARVLSLDDARILALSSDEQLAQMEQSVARARSDVRAASADRLPQLDFSGAWTRNLKKPVFFIPPAMSAGLGGATSVEMGGDWDVQAAATLSLNLWTSGRLSAARGMAAEALEATRWRRALAADAVAFMVESAYDDVLLAQAELRIAESGLALATESLRVTEEAHAQGNASRFDLLRARVELTNRQTPLIQGRNDLQIKTQRLLRICGLDPATPLTLSDILDVVPGPRPLDELLAEMTRTSPELRALEHSLRAADRAVDLARAGRGPVVRLQGQYLLQGQWDGDIFPDSDQAVGSANAAIAVSVPIFDGFASKARIQGRQADRRSTELEFERVKRDRELGVRQAWTNLQNALAALEGRREGVELAEEAYRLSDVRRRNGLATSLEQLDAESALTRARVQLAEILYACNIADANLKLALGGSVATASPLEEKTR